MSDSAGADESSPTFALLPYADFLAAFGPLERRTRRFADLSAGALRAAVAEDARGLIVVHAMLNCPMTDWVDRVKIAGGLSDFDEADGWLLIEQCHLNRLTIRKAEHAYARQVVRQHQTGALLDRRPRFLALVDALIAVAAGAGAVRRPVPDPNVLYGRYLELLLVRHLGG